MITFERRYPATGRTDLKHYSRNMGVLMWCGVFRRGDRRLAPSVKDLERVAVDTTVQPNCTSDRRTRGRCIGSS